MSNEALHVKTKRRDAHDSGTMIRVSKEVSFTVRCTHVAAAWPPKHRQPLFSDMIHEIIQDRFGSVSVQIIVGAENPALACDQIVKFP